MHASPLESQRLQRILAVLRERGSRGCTTMTLNELCGSTRASSDVSEARSRGCIITAIYEGKTDNNRRCYRYVLVSEPGKTAQPAPLRVRCDVCHGLGYVKDVDPEAAGRYGVKETCTECNGEGVVVPEPQEAGS